MCKGNYFDNLDSRVTVGGSVEGRGFGKHKGRRIDESLPKNKQPCHTLIGNQERPFSSRTQNILYECRHKFRSGEKTTRKQEWFVLFDVCLFCKVVAGLTGTNTVTLYSIPTAENVLVRGSTFGRPGSTVSQRDLNYYWTRDFSLTYSSHEKLVNLFSLIYCLAGTLSGHATRE